jgi:hypothetical protein
MKHDSIKKFRRNFTALEPRLKALIKKHKEDQEIVDYLEHILSFLQHGLDETDTLVDCILPRRKKR